MKGINDFISNAQGMGIVKKAFQRDGLKTRQAMVKQVKAGKRAALTSYTIEDDGPKAFTFENVQGCFIVLLIKLIGACDCSSWKGMDLFDTYMDYDNMLQTIESSELANTKIIDVNYIL